MTKAQEKAAEKAEARKMLRRLCRPGTTVYGIVRSVSRSGMSRAIDFYSIHGSDRVYLSGYIATLLGYSRTREGALKVGGCGMDMVFAVVYELACAIHPREKCKANDGTGRDVARGKRQPLSTLAYGYTLRSDCL